MKRFFPLILLLFVVILMAVPIFTKQSTHRKNLPQADASYWVVDVADNKYLTHTSIPLSVGDEYISADNKVYEIIKIVKDRAYVQQIE